MTEAGVAMRESETMPTLEGLENRYALRAGTGEAALVRRVPGGRYSPSQRCWLFPRQPGVVFALDRVFGPRGWKFSPELEIDVDSARKRDFAAPQSEAHVELDGSQLTVQCAIGDRELVKTVPGYRWSPAQRRWSVAALPLALDTLRERFGAKLIVGPGVEALIELRRGEEMAADAVPPPARAGVPDNEGAEVPSGVAEMVVPPALPGTAEAVPAQPFDEALVALAAAVARIDEKLDRLLGTAAAVPVAATPAVQDVATRNEDGIGGADEGWCELLSLAESNPAAALDQANRLLQTSEAGEDPALRAVAGIAALRAGQTEHGWGHVSRVTANGLAGLEPRLGEAFRAAYVALALQLINDDCGPAERVESAAGLARLLNEELMSDGGFADEAIGSEGSRGTLDLLVNDRGLREVAPALSDYCRIAQLLATVRSGGRLAAERVAGVLREGSLSSEAEALAIILFANVCMGQPCINEWAGAWPSAEHEAPISDGAWLVQLALKLLPKLERELAAQAAMAVLGCIAAGPAEQATLSQRRELVQAMPEAWPFRQPAEFLAVFRLAATGERLPLAQHFPGYLHRIAGAPLEQSAPHLTEVYLQGSGVAGSAVKPISDGPYLEALQSWGVHDPVPEVIDLLELLAEGSRPDNALNALAGKIEDGSFPGADRFSRTQRKEVYQRALAASLKTGHDGDAREAFDRLVRELRDEGASIELRNLCATFQGGMKALRIPALIVQLDCLLEDGAPFDEVLEALLHEDALRSDDESERPLDELTGLAEIYPQLDEMLQALIAKRGHAPTVEAVLPDLSGRRVVVVGGHQWLRKRALPLMRDRWGMEVEWLEPQQAKNGPQLLGLAGGASELVVINTRCISHAASGRATKEAEAAGTRWLAQDSRGVGSLLTFVREAFAEKEAGPEKRMRKVDTLKRRTRR